MTKSLANKLYMKQRVCSFKIQDGKGIEDQIDDFIKILYDFENIEVKLEEDDKSLMRLQI